uniref:Putative secreted protein n=1 Tax=Anopheles triannulatus TaxID=58253 RepID=A0A2M4B4P9_9DIPT
MMASMYLPSTFVTATLYRLCVGWHMLIIRSYTPGTSWLNSSTTSCFFLRRASSCLSILASPSCSRTLSSSLCSSRMRSFDDPTSWLSSAFNRFCSSSASLLDLM